VQTIKIQHFVIGVRTVPGLKNCMYAIYKFCGGIWFVKKLYFLKNMNFVMLEEQLNAENLRTG